MADIRTDSELDSVKVPTDRGGSATVVGDPDRPFVWIEGRDGRCVGVIEAEQLEPLRDALNAVLGDQDVRTAERHRRQIEFIEILADGGRIEVNGVPWREMFDRINALVSDPV